MIEKSISYEEIENGKIKKSKRKVEAFPDPDENLLLEFNRYQKRGGELNLRDWLDFYHSDWYDKDKLAKEDFPFGEDTLGYQEYQNYLGGLKAGEKPLSFSAYMNIADISPFDFEGAKGGRVSKFRSKKYPEGILGMLNPSQHYNLLLTLGRMVKANN